VPDNRILLGVIGRAHGVRGLVRVTSHTADPTSLTAYGPLTDDKGRRFVLRWRGEGIAEVSELVDGVPVALTDRTQAEKLTNTRLHIDRARLPPPEDEEEFYLADLIGLEAIDPDGARLGRVAVVHDYGAGTSLEIERDGGASVIIPFTKAVVPVVDIASGRLTVVTPEVVDAIAQGGIAQDGIAQDGTGQDGTGQDGNGQDDLDRAEMPSAATLRAEGRGSTAA
jgi:16S rRNA processing protein RimM